MILATLTLIFWIVTVRVSWLIGADREYTRGYLDGVKERQIYENKGERR